MHTFFINTSKKEINEHDVLFDIHYENKKLVTMECLMSDWYDEDKGYIACVKKISDMIDGYVQLNNTFNLIVYIDLPENKAYSSIQRDAFHDKEREECCSAMRILYTHIISESIVNKLVSSGRKPQNILIMFGEEKKFTELLVVDNDPRKAGVMKQVFNFIGLPRTEDVEIIAKTVQGTSSADKVALFKEKIFEKCGEELVPGIRDGYCEELQLWCDEVINEADISNANSSLFEKISNINKVESDRIGIETVSCPYDCYACEVNKSVLALSEVNIALFLLKCVELNSIFEPEAGENTKRVLEFRLYSLQEIAPILKLKKDIYEAKLSEIEALATSYSELKLAPRLSAFDHAKFGLDMYGDVATEFVINDVASENDDENSNKQEANENNKQSDEAIILKGNDKEVSVVQKQGRSLFSKEEYQACDYNYEEGRSQMFSKKTTPEQYIEQAQRVRKHHLDYLKKLKIHVSNVLSNYAGKSIENKPALLQVGRQRYAAQGEENKILESVKSISNKAYETMVNQYMEFCAGRSVAISDIEEQCNWFVSKVNQIKESLRKIKLVAIGLLAAIIVFYLPFFVIQFENIVKNALTFTVALCSVAIPVVLLYIVFTIMAAAQKKKYIKAWKDFEEKSNQALEENKKAVQQYDRLLSVVVPGLRWVYEYKSDVEYCAECCSIADAKIEHHKRKLRDRVRSIQNVLSDLEFNETENENTQHKIVDSTDLVDYNLAFCSGKKNQKFYSVIDTQLLKTQNK